VAAVPLAMLLFASRGAERQEAQLMLFAPCRLCERDCVAWNLEEITTLPPEARGYVYDTSRACAIDGERRPHIGALGTLTWGLGATAVDTATGERSKGVARDVVMLINANAASAPVSIRHTQASAAQPVRVEFTADGRHLTRELTTPEWTVIDVPLANGWRSWLRGAHRVDVTFSRAGAEWK
jgi:hypothetical protein